MPSVQLGLFRSIQIQDRRSKSMVWDLFTVMRRDWAHAVEITNWTLKAALA